MSINTMHQAVSRPEVSISTTIVGVSTYITGEVLSKVTKTSYLVRYTHPIYGTDTIKEIHTNYLVLPESFGEKAEKFKK